jgi:hypothetical protein
MRILALVGLATLVTAEVATATLSLAAQPTSIPQDAGEPWLHAATGISFPAEVSGLKRTNIRWFSAPEVDVAAIYTNADQSEVITLYLFRNTSADVSVWFDRARVAILLRREMFGDVTPAGIRPFTPRGQDLATGLMESYRGTGPFSATELAVLPVKGFYAKVRASSTRKGSPTLAIAVGQLLDAMKWTSDRQQPLAAAISDCSAPLPTGKRAKRIKASKEERMMAGILGGLIAQVTNDQKVKPAAKPPTFCREPGSGQLAMGIYRPDASTERYTMAVGDAGQAVVVGRNELAEAVTKSKQPRYSVTLVQLHQTASFPDFSALPSPKHIVEEIGKSRPVSVSATWGNKRTINLNAR